MSYDEQAQAKRERRLSKFLSLVLRHKPEQVGIALDSAGWVDVDMLLAAMNAHGADMDRALLTHIVQSNAKQRFAFSQDGMRIRANQGHSIDIVLGLPTQTPPEQLYHGTARQTLPAIRATGLQRQSRQHVHLSRDVSSARQVGMRHGSPVVLTVQAGQMHADGYDFYLSDNGVWLTTSVPVQYLFLDGVALLAYGGDGE